MNRRISASILGLLLASGTSHAVTRTSCEDLRADLKSPNHKTREDAATALAQERCQDSVTALAALVRDPEPKVRLAVVKALRAIRDPSAVPALTTFLADGAEAIRGEAVAALVEVYSEREGPGTFDRFLEAFSDEIDEYRIPPFVDVDPSVAPALAGSLRDPSSAVRRSAAHAIGILRGTAAVPALISALGDPDADVRAAVVTALEKTATAEQAKARIPALSDESRDVRLRAMRALGRLKVREAGPTLRAVWQANKRREAEPPILDALARVGDPELKDLFLSLVQESDPTRRRYGIEGLARISDASALAGFKKDYQRESNEEMRLTYCFALALLGDRAFVDSLVLALPKSTLRDRCRGYLVELGPAILPDLYPYLSDPSADVRANLADLMAAMGDPAAIPQLEVLRRDPNSEVVDRATRAIERLRRAGPATPR